MRNLFSAALALSLLAAPLQARNGMTWMKLSHSPTYSTDAVGCPDCNPYTGDTPCSTQLPILCLRRDVSPNPGLATGSNNGWAGGHISLTQPISGLALEDLANANSLCEAAFGPGYVMGEFHDGGGGWNWNAYGNVKTGTRFWVYINDTAGNCWDLP